MNMYLFFKNLNILCIFSDRFFDPVFFWFWFFGSTGSTTGPVLVTLVFGVISSYCGEFARSFPVHLFGLNILITPYTTSM